MLRVICFRLSLLLFLFSFSKAFCGNERKYASYYKTINEAELCVVDLNFEQAYRLYYTAFDRYEKHRIADLHNAALCAILTGQFNQAKLWIEAQVIQGVSVEDFNVSTYKQLPDSIWSDIRSRYDSLRSIYFSRMDVEFKSILDTMSNEEQRYVYLDKKQYDSLVYEHAKVLHRLISERGIPQVPMFEGQLLPADVIRHHFALRNQLKYCSKSGIDITVEPYCRMAFNKYDLEPLLVDAVFCGNISPNFVAMCMEHSELDSARQLGSLEVYIDFNTKTLIYNYPKYSIETVDKYRNYLGLESLRDAVRKNYEIALYYNQTTYPFDEHLRRFKEIGYTKSNYTRLSKEEQNKLFFESIDITQKIRKTFFDKGINIYPNGDSKPIYIESKGRLLKEFKISQTSRKVSLNPPE
ncbi:hypothetical protein CYCD_30100 [Tenuifilaceae bacterium CYCD]|nr:hypothetical protein CYCD_30100 [Tenuifilaceae bacterium CYCD]